MSLLKFYEYGSFDTNPQLLIIMMHGYGGNKEDFAYIAQFWLKNYVPKAHIICPDGPYLCEEYQQENSRQWFSLRSKDNKFLINEVENVLPIVSAFIKEQRERLRPQEDRVILVGFSQGAMLSLYTGLYGEQQVLGVLGYSGWLNRSEESTLIKNKPNILLVHGENDNVVPCDICCKQVEAFLLSKNLHVESFVESDLQHEISANGIKKGGEFIRGVIS